MPLLTTRDEYKSLTGGMRACGKGIWKDWSYQMEGKSKDKWQRYWRTNHPWSWCSSVWNSERAFSWARLGDIDWSSLAVIDQLSALSLRESVKTQAWLLWFICVTVNFLCYFKYFYIYITKEILIIKKSKHHLNEQIALFLQRAWQVQVCNVEEKI